MREVKDNSITSQIPDFVNIRQGSYLLRSDDPLLVSSSYYVDTPIIADIENQLTFNYEKDITFDYGEIEQFGSVFPITDTMKEKKIAPNPIIFQKSPPLPVETTITLQKWEGTVLEINNIGFTAKLLDLMGDADDSIGDFYFEEISRDDEILVKIGAVFYYNIGYRESESGRRSRESIIIFRRLPVWNEKDIEEAKERADYWNNIFQGNHVVPET